MYNKHKEKYAGKDISWQSIHLDDNELVPAMF